MPQSTTEGHGMVLRLPRAYNFNHDPNRSSQYLFHIHFILFQYLFYIPNLKILLEFLVMCLAKISQMNNMTNYALEMKKEYIAISV